MKIFGNIVDIHLREIYPAEITVSDGIIASIERTSHVPEIYILPGLIDSHIHIESSMVTPAAFGFEAVRHGTAGVVSDPHEIANVLGLKGVEFMITDAKRSPVRFWFGAPSCVPATDFESSGARLGSEDIEKLMRRPDIRYLSEMMNFPGVISKDNEVMRKIASARRNGKPIDGHAPGLSGESLRNYIGSGISTDHECSSLEEAMEKISLGMKVMIREGSAARNLDTLKELYNLYPEMLMLCSDDLHPEMVVTGHINRSVGKLISEGFDVFDVIRSATSNPVKHYGLEAGLLQAGQSADFIIVKSLERMDVLETWIAGNKVFDRGERNFIYELVEPLNNFQCSLINVADISIRWNPGRMRVIEAFDGDLVTKEFQITVNNSDFIYSDTRVDILKIVVKERYKNAPAAVGFIKGFGLKNGAFAGSISHDSHNIICVGTNDEEIVSAMNEIIKHKGGLAVSAGGKTSSLQLDIGGIMSTKPCFEVAQEYKSLNKLVKSLGCPMEAPFMTLSFMALLVIPHLKIGDQGLFDVDEFKLVSLFAE